MQIFNDIDKWRSFRQQDLFNNQKIGLVPTMGNLHVGHESLIKRSLQDNDLTVVYIFVNRFQFNEPDDYAHYPRTLKEDIATTEKLGIDFLLVPEDAQSLYPDNYRYKVTETTLSQQMEGKHRPGHFDAVLTIVLKFLHLVKPNHVYFGEKDTQQLSLLQGMVDAFFIDTKVVACPTMRTPQGLALSSRNQRLSVQQLKQAHLFPQLLQSDKGIEEIRRELTAQGFKVDYIEEVGARRYGAVHLGTVRLIDNVEISKLGSEAT
ncbi:MAG: pantoate--beta-alanine ligase [Gammaproteobacteria bacterium]